MLIIMMNIIHKDVIYEGHSTNQESFLKNEN